MAKVAADGKPSPGARVIGLGLLLLAAAIIAALVYAGAVVFWGQFGNWDMN